MKNCKFSNCCDTFCTEYTKCLIDYIDKKNVKGEKRVSSIKESAAIEANKKTVIE